MFTRDLITKFEQYKTPFYHYDLQVLDNTLQELTNSVGSANFKVHYALKANVNDIILEHIKKAGLGADCVSGNEIKQALKIGFDPSEVVFAGVGKSDDEIRFAIENNISCFNVESIQELSVIDEIASTFSKKAKIALRINPNVSASTHKYITTGLNENKFGIGFWELEAALEVIQNSKHLLFNGLHFHIGSQIRDLDVFIKLCDKINELQTWFYQKGINIETINVGGGLGINYDNPDIEPIPDFKNYFELFKQHLNVSSTQTVHFELGRSVVGNCGNLISKVLYIKEGISKNFAILDAGMTELMRPALYQAKHKIENLNSNFNDIKKYQVVGPICESSDSFGEDVELPITKRGDLVAIRSTGAYGEIMSSSYNMREKPKRIILIWKVFTLQNNLVTICQPRDSIADLKLLK